MIYMFIFDGSTTLHEAMNSMVEKLGKFEIISIMSDSMGTAIRVEAGLRNIGDIG